MNSSRAHTLVRYGSNRRADANMYAICTYEWWWFSFTEKKGAKHIFMWCELYFLYVPQRKGEQRGNIREEKNRPEDNSNNKSWDAKRWSESSTCMLMRMNASISRAPRFSTIYISFKSLSLFSLCLEWVLCRNDGTESVGTSLNCVCVYKQESHCIHDCSRLSFLQYCIVDANAIADDVLESRKVVTDEWRWREKIQLRCILLSLKKGNMHTIHNARTK